MVGSAIDLFMKILFYIVKNRNGNSFWFATEQERTQQLSLQIRRCEWQKRYAAKSRKNGGGKLFS
jgi:hypothetical protein